MMAFVARHHEIGLFIAAQKYSCRADQARNPVIKAKRYEDPEEVKALPDTLGR